MIVLGLLFILTAAGAVVFAVVAPSSDVQTIELSALGVTVSASPLAMFVAGALSVLLFVLGLLLISRGARRRASSRKELRELRKGQADAAAQKTTDAGRHSSGHDRSSTASGGGTSPGATEDQASTNTNRATTSTDTDADNAAAPDGRPTGGPGLDNGSGATTAPTAPTGTSADTADTGADKGTDSSR